MIVRVQEVLNNEYANYNHGSAIPRDMHVCTSINTKLYGRGMFPGYYKFDGIQQ